MKDYTVINNGYKPDTKERALSECKKRELSSSASCDTLLYVITHATILLCVSAFSVQVTTLFVVSFFQEYFSCVNDLFPIVSDWAQIARCCFVDGKKLSCLFGGGRFYTFSLVIHHYSYSHPYFYLTHSKIGTGNAPVAGQIHTSYRLVYTCKNLLTQCIRPALHLSRLRKIISGLRKINTCLK